MTHLTTTARILLGIAFIVFGINFWLKFMPVPPPPSELAGKFIGALFASGFLAFVKVLEILGGVALLSKRFAPLGLTLLGPILVVISLYDVFLAKSINPVVIGLNVLALILLISWRGNFKGLLASPKH